MWRWHSAGWVADGAGARRSACGLGCMRQGGAAAVPARVVDYMSWGGGCIRGDGGALCTHSQRDDSTSALLVCVCVCVCVCV
jgi:hypothetical protein